MWRSKSVPFGDSRGNLVIVYDRILAFQSLTEITEVIVIVTLLSGLFLGSVLYVLMRRGLLRRVEQLYVGSEAIGRGNLDYRIPSLGDDEIGDLGKALNTMARNLEKTTTSRDRLDMEVKEREQALADLAESAAALRRSNAELEQFAYVASHDLQEPLRMVGSYLQLLSRRYRGYIAADADKWIDFAVDGANRMKQLIEDLLAYSRVSSHGVEQVLVDSEQALGEVLRDLAAAVAESGARISHDQLPMVLADPQQLNQLLQNLIGNAIKYRGDQPLEIHVSAESDGPGFRFLVRDNGIGIEPRFAERIFQIFQRLHGVGKYSGTGIGLAVCKRIVERHGGRIWVESQAGQGSTFFFTLPGAAASVTAGPGEEEPSSDDTEETRYAG